jgi:hypothetical protein
LETHPEPFQVGTPGRPRVRIFYVYACEIAGHAINWTPVEEIYTAVCRA